MTKEGKKNNNRGDEEKKMRKEIYAKENEGKKTRNRKIKQEGFYIPSWSLPSVCNEKPTEVQFCI